MSGEERQVSLSEKEIRTLVEILKFAEGACPVESISQDFSIDAGKIEALISKFESA